MQSTRNSILHFYDMKKFQKNKISFQISYLEYNLSRTGDFKIKLLTRPKKKRKKKSSLSPWVSWNNLICKNGRRIQMCCNWLSLLNQVDLTKSYLVPPLETKGSRVSTLNGTTYANSSTLNLPPSKVSSKRKEIRWENNLAFSSTGS